MASRPSSTSSSSNERRLFGLFPYLNEDLKLTILSYVADAPMEMTSDAASSSYTKSSLTHQLPRVSRKFRDLTLTDSYWKDAVLRQTKKEPGLWETALKNIIAESGSNKENENDENDVNVKESPEHALVQQALEAHANACQRKSQQKSPLCCVDNISYESHPYYCDSGNSPTPTKTYKSLYQHVVSNHLRFKGPVFFKPGQLQLGEPYSLCFCEPRYKYLIAQVMRDFPDEAKQGGAIDVSSTSGKLPLFLHANRDPLAPSTPAVVVQVLRCQIQDDGRVDVVLMPLHHVWLEKLWVVPQTGHISLYHAQALRMPQKVTRDMNHLARQEALAHVMEQLATSMVDDDNDDFDRAMDNTEVEATGTEDDDDGGDDDDGSSYDSSGSDFETDDSELDSAVDDEDDDDDVDDLVEQIRRYENDDQELI